MEESQGSLTAPKGAPKAKFSAKQVLEGMPDRPEGLLKEPLKQIPSKPKKEKRVRCYVYLTKMERDQLRVWSQGEDASDVVRTVLRRAMANSESYLKLKF